MNLYVSMRRVWVWALVDIPHHHDRDDDILLLHDEKARNGLLDRLLHKREGSPLRWFANR